MNNRVLKEDVQQFAEQFVLFENLRGKSFLITGATGLIGSVMIKCLLALNRIRHLDIKIIAVVRNIEKTKQVFGDEFDEIKFIKMDLSQIKLNHIKDEVDYIVHLASPTASKYFVEHPVETLRNAIEGTTAMLEYAKAIQVKGMVFASSLEAYGSNFSDNQIDEKFQGYVNPLEVRSSYNIGKRACECLCHSYAKEYDVNVMMARLTQTFGPGVSSNDNRVFAQFAHSIIENKDIVMHTTGESSKPYCYTIDCVSAILFVLLNGEKGEAYNVANESTYISIKDMAEMLLNCFNPQIHLVQDIHNDMGYAPTTKLNLSSEKLRRLGWTPKYDLHQMFDRYIKSLMNN